MPATGTGEAKRALRAQVLAARAALPADERARRSTIITGHLLALPQLARGSLIAAYLSFGDEYDTRALIEQLRARGQRIALPRMIDHQRPASRHLALHEVADVAHDTLAGRWGIREPDPQRCAPVRADQLDAVLVPGVAFDAGGGRLGYGAGYYDRLLAQVRTRTSNASLVLAAAFSVQRVAQVPMDAHDQRIAWLVTEDGPLSCIGEASSR